jgi:16S rRNA (guanine966-N2)-methyltransferase
MKIISGAARGINLDVPKGLDVRPTAVRAKKALFDSLGSFAELTVADVFAGSGAMGLEAASRGAKAVVFVESAPKSLDVIAVNIGKVVKSGAVFESRVMRGSAFSPGTYVSLTDFSPDIIFADPPYAESADALQKLTALEAFSSWAKDSLLIWELPERSRRAAVMLPSPPWKTGKLRAYEGVEFLFLRQN